MANQKEDLFPNYLKIQNYISEKIQSGELPAGSKIPTEVELASMFSVSRVTANKAVKEMSLMGILKRVRGKGTFVCSPRDASHESMAFVSVSKLDITQNREHDLVQFRSVEGDPSLLERMQLPERSMLYEIVLANKNKGKLESLDYVYIPQIYVNDIMQALSYMKNNYAFTYLKTNKDLRTKYLRIHPNPTQPKFLELPHDLTRGQSSLLTWYTDICDENMKLLGTTYTIFLEPGQDIPLFVFSI